jgi:hypothetical protein
MGWVGHSEAVDEACAMVESVGWVMCIGKRTVQIGPHIATWKGKVGCVQGYITIPLSGILKKRVLERAPL